jgi:hypothetical protein
MAAAGPSAAATFGSDVESAAELDVESLPPGHFP